MQMRFLCYLDVMFKLFLVRYRGIFVSSVLYIYQVYIRYSYSCKIDNTGDYNKDLETTKKALMNLNTIHISYTCEYRKSQIYASDFFFFSRSKLADGYANHLLQYRLLVKMHLVQLLR